VDLSTEEAKSASRVKFFEFLFGEQKGYLCIAITDPRAPKSSFRQSFFNWPDDKIKMEEYILSVENKLNVYFCINLLNKPIRKKENCLPTRLVWADLDDVHPDSFTEIPPPVVIASSLKRFQAIWRLTMLVKPEVAEEYSRRIAYAIDADKSGWDLTQLLRVPFTNNFKYKPVCEVMIERFLGTEAKPLLFESLPSTIEPVEQEPIPLEILPAGDVILKYLPVLERTQFMSLYSTEVHPQDDWSKVLWRFIHECFRAGMEMEEVFAVSLEAKCNKYARDGRPIDHLWHDVLRAAKFYKIDLLPETLELPTLIEAPHSETFLDEYREWATSVTDAAPGFHDLCMMVALSAIVSNSVRLETSIGAVVPNLWGILLGDSTLTRKTTAMRLVMDMLILMDNELIVATDGSPEGVLTALAERPNRASMFFRDEISGFFDAISRKEYLSGMAETLTHLYDVPPVYTRRLRKETIIVESPAFIFLGGGVAEKVFEVIDDSMVYSGFLPRFLVCDGEVDPSDRRPMGPPTQDNIETRSKIVSKLADFTELYSGNEVQKIGGEKVLIPKRIKATLTQEAWSKNAEIEMTMIKTAYSNPDRNLALPTFDRLSRSILKMGVIFGAIRQRPVDGAILIEEGDILNASWYAQQWGQSSINLFTNAGKKPVEKTIDKIFEWINENPGVGRQWILRRFHLTSKEATLLLDTLIERGLVRFEKRGKETRYWII